MPYCTSEDLLISGDVMLPPTLSLDKFVQLASDDMDSKLGYRYEVPILTVGLPSHQIALLKSINAKLATGRLIMATAVGGEDTAVHQYALYLIKEAEMDLMSIANGQVDLQAPEVDEDGNSVTPGSPLDNDPYARTPGAWNPDSTSPVTVFEKNILTVSEPLYWDPATNVSIDGEIQDVR